MVKGPGNQPFKLRIGQENKKDFGAVWEYFIRAPTMITTIEREVTTEAVPDHIIKRPPVKLSQQGTYNGEWSLNDFLMEGYGAI